MQILAMVASFAVILWGCEKEPKTVSVTGVSLNPPTLTLTEGDTQSLTVTVIPENANKKDVVWSSSDTGVATVEAGLVTAVAPGSATITVKTVDGAKTATCAVTVTAKVYPVTGISVDPESKEVEVGEKFTITATVSPDNATNKQIVWTSDKEEVATVSDGEVTAVAVGTATITAKTVDGEFTATCEVIVKKTVTTVDDPVLGWFLNKDGSITEAKQESGDKQSFAVIAYVGSVEKYFNHFIALALTDCSTTGEEGTGEYKMSFADAIANVGKYAANHPVTINGTTYNTASGTSVYDTVERSNSTSSVTRTADAEIGWRLPSVTDFRYAMQGLTSANEADKQFNATEPAGIAPNAANNIKSNEGDVVVAAIKAACGSDPATKLYWVSSLDGTKPTTHAWYYRIDMHGWYLVTQTSTAPGARPVFAY